MRSYLAIFFLLLAAVPSHTQTPPPATIGIVSSNGHLTTSNSQANIDIFTTAVGSGTNGPSTAQFGERIQVSKENWYMGSAKVGEVDGLDILVRQGGARSDSSGILIDVQNQGNGFLSATEMVSNILVHNPQATDFISYGMDLQDGVLDGINGDYYGRVFTSDFGPLKSAILVQNNPGSSWGSIIKNFKDNALNFAVTDDGLVSASQVNVPGGILGGDTTNGSEGLGIAGSSATPYIDFFGNNVAVGSRSARIISDSASQLSILGSEDNNARLYVRGTMIAQHAIESGSQIASPIYLIQNQRIFYPDSGSAVLLPYNTGLSIIIPKEGTISSATMTLPASNTIAPGFVARVITNGTIKSLTVNSADSMPVVGAPVTMSPSAPFAMYWDGTDAVWYRFPRCRTAWLSDKRRQKRRSQQHRRRPAAFDRTFQSTALA